MSQRIEYRFTCNACGAAELGWEKTDSGWRLVADKGVPHRCRQHRAEQEATLHPRWQTVRGRGFAEIVTLAVKRGLETDWDAGDREAEIYASDIDFTALCEDAGYPIKR